MEMYLTFDVEEHSFETNTPDDSVVKRVENEAIPRLLEILEASQIRATFFSTAQFAKKSPKSISNIINKGHEIGCHRFDHYDYYDSLKLTDQIEFMKKSKAILEDISGKPVVSFRAPALRIKSDTVKALEANSFKNDS